MGLYGWRLMLLESADSAKGKSFVGEFGVVSTLPIGEGSRAFSGRPVVAFGSANYQRYGLVCGYGRANKYRFWRDWRLGS